jgi:hypothetical protein
MVAGLLAGGSLLDWPEQAAIVLPVLLASLVLTRPPSDPAIDGREGEAVRDSTRPSADGVGRASTAAVRRDCPPASSSVAECTS